MKASNFGLTAVRNTVLVALFLLIAPVHSILAKDSLTIQQKDHRFSELFVKVKNNDVIKFVNLDSVNHRLIFSHKGRQEQMNAIEPGKTQEVTLSHSGIYDVQCKHHPEMKLTIFVPYSTKLTKNKSIYAF